MTLGNYSQFLLSGLSGIGDNIGRRAYQQQEDKSLEALRDSLYKNQSLNNLGQQTQQQPQTISNLGQNGQPMNLIPQGYLDNARQSESGGNLNAKNHNSSATGPYQFTQGTWADLAKNNPDLGLTPDGRTDAAQNEKAITAFTQQNAKQLYANGVPVNPGTLYAAHFLGAGGALKVLSSDDNAQLNGVLSPEVIKSNPFLNGMTVAQFKDMAAKKGGNPQGGYQVASNDPNFMPQTQGLQAPPTTTNQAPNPQANPVAQTFAAQAQDTGQGAPQQPVQQPQAPPQMAQNSPQGLPQQFSPQNSQSLLPDRETMLQLLKSEATRPYALALAQAAQKGMNPGFKIITAPDGTVLKVDQSTGNPEVLIKADGDLNKNQVISSGGTLVDNKGKVLYQNNSSSLDPDSVDVAAHQLMSGDTSALTGLGYGAAGSANRAAVRNRMTDIMKEQGLSGEQIALRNAEFFGTKAGERALGTRTANIGLAANTANQFAPIAISLSNKIDRTNYPSLNSVFLAVERGTGDPTVAQFAVANNSLINAYARAINPNGVPTDSDKAHARHILTTAYSKGQYEAAVKQMQIEIQAELKAPGNVRQEFRDMQSGKDQQKNDIINFNDLPE